MSELIISISGVRGIVGDSLTPDVAMSMSAAFAGATGSGPVLVASDGRTSGELFRNACIAGLCGAGRDVVDLGVATTPTTEFAVPLRGAAGAVIITASHNPAEWNGLKFLGSDGTFVRQETVDAIKVGWQSGTHDWKPWDSAGSIERWTGASEVHVGAILGLDIINVDACRDARIPVVLDSICASGGTIAPMLLQALGCPTTQVNGEVTGLFPRMPEPIPANIVATGEAVRESGAAVGLVLDPDSDRLALLDHEGVPIGEEYTLALGIHSIRTRSNTNAPVAVNASTSRMVDDVGKQLGFDVIRTKVGEINVVDGMLGAGTELGGEGNGGMIYGPLHYGRDGLLGIAVILDLMARTGVSLRELTEVVPRYFIHKTKVSVERDSIAGLLDSIRDMASGKGAEADDTDGVKLVWHDRWLHVRPSNTEPVVRFMAEAPAEAEAVGLCDEVMALCTRS
jgi:phosphomannomutase